MLIQRARVFVCHTQIASCLWIALLVQGCVEIDMHRTVRPDRSGRETITMRAPSTGGGTDAFPGFYSGATCRSSAPQADGGRTLHRAEATFTDVAAVRHRAGFLTSSASIETAENGTNAYREVLTNSFYASLKRAPTDEARETLAAAIADAKRSLAGARLTYTIELPGAVTKSNADRTSGSSATWVLTADKLFTEQPVELTAEYRTQPEAVAAVPAAAPKAPEPKAEAAPAPQPEIVRLAAAAQAPPAQPAEPPAPKPPVVAAAPEPVAAPEPTEPKTSAPAEREPETLLAQAEDAPAAPAEAPAPEKPKDAPTAPAEAAAPEAPKATLEESPADDETTKQVKKLFAEALGKLDYKNYEQAAELLQKAIALKPNETLISNLYGQVVAKFLDAALASQNADLKARAEELQKIAYKGRLRQLHDPERIKKLIAGLKENFIDRTFAMEELTLAGDYAVPGLLKFLQENTDAEQRAYAAYVLSRLRGTAVPAIMEALKYKDPLVRQIIVQALEVIGDPRSIPALLWLAQEANAHPLVAAGAKRALLKISDAPNLLQTPASVAFLDLAKDFYEGNRKVVLPHVYEHLVWRYDPKTNELVSESVPRHLYPFRMAEEMCRNALLANPNFEPAVPLLIGVLFAQQNLLEGFFSSIKGKETPLPEEQEEAELARPIYDRLQMAPAIAQSAGRKFVYAALQRALRDAQPEVAISCIRVLPSIADGSALPTPPVPEEEALKATKGKPKPAARPIRVLPWYGPEEKEQPAPPPPVANPNSIPLDGSPLVQALSCPDRRVRYAAAEALVAIGPTQMILDAPKVMNNLSQALAETAYHVALLVDEDEAAAEELRPLLSDVGVQPVLARSQRDALTAARELPPKDFVIVSGLLKRVEPAEMLASLRRIYTLGGVPAIVITTRSDLPKMREIFAKENVTFLLRPFVAASVRGAIDEVLKTTPAPKGKDLAASYASSAARALASVNAATSIFKLEDALDALLEAVSSAVQPDAVRIPCVTAIQHAAKPRSVPYLIQVYGDPKSSKDLRLSLLAGIGACAVSRKDLPEDVDAKVNEVIRGAAVDADPDFRKAAAFAFGLRGGAEGDFVETIDDLVGKNSPPPPPAAPAPAPAEGEKPAAGEAAPAPEAPATPPAEAPKAPPPAVAPEEK